MTRFHIREKVKKVVKVTAKVAIVTVGVAKEMAETSVEDTLHHIHQEMKEGMADAITSDKHWLKDE